MQRSGSNFPILLLQLCFLLYRDVGAVPLSSFYPFGTDSGDTLLHRNDDDTSPEILLNLGFTFFGQTYQSIFVSNNGIITPGIRVTQYIPSQSTNFPLIAVFWSDVDTRPPDGGYVWYRHTTDSSLIQRALVDIQMAYNSVSSIDYLLMATWDHVGYFNGGTDRNNTFQVVLAVSRMQTYAIYHYADGLIQWSKDGNALAGYSAGDGVTFYNIPGSLTLDILNITLTTNVNVPGKWVFRLDQDDLVVPSCDYNLLGFVSVYPRLGSVLGGTLVTVNGPCFDRRDSIQCIFADVPVPAVYVDRNTVACVSPAMESIGSVEMKLVVSSSGEISFEGFALFYSVPILNAHGVTVRHSLLVDLKDTIDITWDPNDVIPSNDDPTTYRVDIHVYAYEHKSRNRQWSPTSLTRESPNNGNAVISGLRSLSEHTEMICIFVSISRRSVGVGIVRRLREINLNYFPFGAGIWSGPLFLVKTDRNINRAGPVPLTRDHVTDRECSLWLDQQKRKTPTNFDSLPACPPTQGRAALPNSGLEEASYTSVSYDTNYHLQFMSLFHPGASTCYQQTAVTSGRPGQECCYDSNGNLIVGSPGGGSANRYAPVDFTYYQRHIEEDLIPNAICCPRQCVDYYRERPSDDGSNYNPPPPACVYGDPHIITLDGLKYTFNGKGEYTLIETLGGVFTLQGRMVDVDTAQNSSLPTGSPATVFSAIVAKQNDSDTVQFTLAENSTINTTVNGIPVDFDMLTEQSFVNVVVKENNQSYSAFFSSGAYIEVKSENRFISLLLVSLPDSFKDKTEGLMGTFNGNTEDDLIPKGTEVPISSNSSLQDIHNLFGVTWIVNNSNNSLFLYRESLGEDWSLFYHPNYTPVFVPTFDDPELEAEATTICGDSVFCLFDIAATQRLEIGMATAINNEEFEIIVNDSAPVICDPPCENGACVETNTCLCTQGYIGDSCSTAVITECEENVCEGGGTCHVFAGSLMCTCPPNLIGGRCDLLPPPDKVYDNVYASALMTVPIHMHPEQFGFRDYKDLVSICYEIRGEPGHTVNLVSSEYISINALYEPIEKNEATITLGTVGIHTIDHNGDCVNIQVNRDCSILYNGYENYTTSNNITIEVSSEEIYMSFSNYGNQIELRFQRLVIGSHTTLNFTIARKYAIQDETHGLIGQFWNVQGSSELFEGDSSRLVPGYTPYILTLSHPSRNLRRFVGVLIPRLWNREAGQCLYAGDSQGGSTLVSSAALGSVIQGEYSNYRVKNLFATDFPFSKFRSSCT